MTIIDAHSHLWLKQDTCWNGRVIRSKANGRADFLGEEVHKRFYLLAVIVVLAAIAAFGLWWKSSSEVSRVSLSQAKIFDIAPMVQLSTVEFYEDLPLKAHVGRRHFFGRMTVSGSIGFDLDKIAQEQRGDTIFVTLPPEIVTVRESTAQIGRAHV